MKRLLIILVLVLLLAGGGGGAWWFMNQGAEQAEAEAPVEAAAKPNFVKIDPIILPLIQQNKVTRFVTVVITLEMPVDDAILKVGLVKPRLRPGGTGNRSRTPPPDPLHPVISGGEDPDPVMRFRRRKIREVSL